jgi:hypothetical protein
VAEALQQQNAVLKTDSDTLLPEDALGQHASKILAQRKELEQKASQAIAQNIVAKAETKQNVIPEATRLAVGTHYEQTVRNQYQQRTKRQIQDGNARRYQKKQLWTILGVPVGIGGRCDGVEIDPATRQPVHLIEIKTRARHLFWTIPLYEKVQLHVYMFIYGLDDCVHIQRHADETEETRVKFDCVFWTETVLPRLKAAAHNLIYLSQSSEAFNSFSKNREAYLQQYLPPPQER